MIIYVLGSFSETYFRKRTSLCSIYLNDAEYIVIVWWLVFMCVLYMFYMRQVKKNYYHYANTWCYTGQFWTFSDKFRYNMVYFAPYYNQHDNENCKMHIRGNDHGITLNEGHFVLAQMSHSFLHLFDHRWFGIITTALSLLLVLISKWTTQHVYEHFYEWTCFNCK